MEDTEKKMLFGIKKPDPGRELPPVVEIGKDIGTRFSEIHIGTYASSIAFFFFLSFIPILIIAVRLVPMFGMSEEVVVRIVTRIAPDIASNLLEVVTREIMSISRRILPISLVVLVWAASQGTIALVYGLDKVYNIEEHRNYFVICLFSILYTIAMLILVAFLIFLIFGNAVSRYLNDLFPELGVPGPVQTTWHSVLFLVVGTLIFTLIYTFIPAGKRKPARQVPGALFSAGVWLIFSAIFRLYMSGENRFTSFYGSVATIAILLFWLYCCFYIFLLGGFVNKYFGDRILPYFLNAKKL